MIRMLLTAALVAGFASAASAQTTKLNQQNDKDEIDSLFAIIDRLTEGASPAERLCYFTQSPAEYRQCRFPFIIKETWVNHSSGSLCRFDKYDDLVNGSPNIKGLGSDVYKDLSKACDVSARMNFEWKLIQRIKREFGPALRKPAG